MNGIPTEAGISAVIDVPVAFVEISVVLGCPVFKMFAGTPEVFNGAGSISLVMLCAVPVATG